MQEAEPAVAALLLAALLVVEPEDAEHLVDDLLGLRVDGSGRGLAEADDKVRCSHSDHSPFLSARIRVVSPLFGSRVHSVLMIRFAPAGPPATLETMSATVSTA